MASQAHALLVAWRGSGLPHSALTTARVVAPVPGGPAISAAEIG